MTTEQFIQKAIEGGWKHQHPFPNDIEYWGELEHFRILLDPLAWQAVGKVDGWDEGRTIDPTYHFAPANMWMWQWKMHRMIDALAEGKTLEEFISTL